MAVKGLDAIAAGVMGAGVLFVWSGLKGASVTQSISALLRGEQPTGEQTLGVNKPIEREVGADAGGVLGEPIELGDPGGTAAQNQAIGQRLAAGYGWGSGPEWAALVALWNAESGWDNKAVNSSSGATGIAQALPATKMSKPAQSPTFNASAQIGWGLRYIKSRYGTPSKAWAFHKAHNWY